MVVEGLGREMEMIRGRGRWVRNGCREMEMRGGGCDGEIG